MRKYAFGIDFGTTNSVAAVYGLLNDVVQPVLYEDLPHPSVIWYSGDGTKVGRDAKRNYNKYIEQPGHSFVKSIKSKLGQNSEVTVLGGAVPAYEIAADIFRHLKRHMNIYFNEETELDTAVVTVPVKFDGRQRGDIRKAAQLAGIHVKSFIHEPFAGVVGYLFGNGIDKAARYEGKSILVFDWGGGTLDITLVKYENGRIFETGTGGIANKAGDYFDQLIENVMIKKFRDSTYLNPDAIHLAPRIKDRLNEVSELNKMELSDTDEVSVLMPNFFEYEDESFALDETLTRSEFEHEIIPTMSEALREIDRTLEQSGSTYDQVGLVLLIGGTCKIPHVVSEIEKLFGSRTLNVKNSNTIIAEGAAIISKHDWKPFLVNPICIQLSDGNYYTVFEKGLPLFPGTTKKEVTFFVTDCRLGEAHLIVTEMRNSNEQVVKSIVNIEASNKVDRKYIEKINVTFHIDNDLVLNIDAVGTIKGKVAKAQIYDICYGLRIE